jgi:hypothetical protein
VSTSRFLVFLSRAVADRWPVLLLDRPDWFSAIASGDIMRVKMMVHKKQIDLKQRFKEDMMATYSFGDTAKGSNVFTPRASDCLLCVSRF